MEKGTRVYTPRFCTVVIEDVFDNINDMKEAGYTEPTHYDNPKYDVRGKSIDMYHMIFAAAHK